MRGNAQRVGDVKAFIFSYTAFLSSSVPTFCIGVGWGEGGWVAVVDRFNISLSRTTYRFLCWWCIVIL